MSASQHIATVVERRPLGAALDITLAAPALTRGLSAGRAVLVQAGPSAGDGAQGGVYLRRTFYPVAITADTWTLRIPPTADWGHAWLRSLQPGAEVDCLGPVGNGWSIGGAGGGGIRNLLCLGQGEHAWSLLPLIAWADAAGLAVTFVGATSTARYAIPAPRLPSSVEYHLLTAEGRPDATAALLSTLSDLLPWADALAVAGPMGLYRPLADSVAATRYGLSAGFCQVLVETQFLCGVGACQACVLDVAGGRRRVCLRGPVFDLADFVRGGG